MLEPKLPKAILYLSERNLRVLLSKLERKKAGEDTECTILKYQDPHSEYKNSSKAIKVVAITNAECYKHRVAGYMLPIDTPAEESIEP